MTSARRIAVVLATEDLPRAREAFRAAVGLCLRGDKVQVVLAVEPPTDDPDIRRAMGALQEFGHSVTRGDTSSAVEQADVVEVWT